MNRRPWYVAGAAIALFGAIAAGFHLWPPAAGQESAAPRATDLASAPGDGRAGNSVAATVPAGPFDALRPRLEAAAADGDADAAFRMGRTLAHCLQYRPIPGDRITQLMAEAIATAGPNVTIGGRPLGDERNMDMLLFAHQEAERLCADTDSLRATPPALDALDYIEQAAEAGHPQAMALYPDLAFREFRTPIELIENAEEVARRRGRAQAHLLAAVRAGEPAALLAASRAYAQDGWLARDPELALAYWLAYRATGDAGRVPESLRDERTAELESLATPAQRERALVRATRIERTVKEQAHAP